MSFYPDYDNDYYGRMERRRRRGVFAFAAIALICVVAAAMIVVYITDDGTLFSHVPEAFSTAAPGGAGGAGTAPAIRTPPPQGAAGQAPGQSGAERTTGRSVADILASDDNPVERVASEVGGSIVGVSNLVTWYSRRDGTSELVEQGAGSGIVVSADGHIVTNYHVIRDAEIVTVLLADGTLLEAEVLGHDERTDLAVLKIDPPSGLKAATLGVSADVKVGQIAIAIGNPLGHELATTVTLGCISAVNRVLTLSDGRTVELMQTDAAISSGNSGGALLNIDGEVIGINTLKAASTTSGGSSVEGLGFAIPIDIAKPVINEIIETGTVTRPGLGIMGTDFTEADAALYGNRYPAGLYVSDTQEGSGAREAGLIKGDIITHMNGRRVYTYDELKRLLTEFSVGDYVDITYYREEAEHTVKVRLIGISG